MGKRLVIYGSFCILLIGLIGCTIVPNENNNKNSIIDAKKGELIQIKSIENFSNINGLKVEKGKFFFSGTKEEKWGFYALDLNTYNTEKKFNNLGDYDVFIPLGGQDAIMVDLDGNLFIREKGRDRKISGEVYGAYSPNILVSPDRKGVLYTKGEQNEAALYRYMIDENKSIKIKDQISKDAFFTFSYTTHWSNKSHYFIFDNDEVYDNNGNLYSSINGTAAKWAPNDSMIAFIRKPQKLKGKQIFSGDWQSYIGNEFVVFNLEDKKEDTVYKSDKGLVDVIDSIQWAKDSSIVGISVGTISRYANGEYDNIEYEKVFTYDVKNKVGKEVEDIPYNFYEVLFNRYIYGSNIGKRDKIEIVEILQENRKIFNKPLMLNSKDMYIISHKDQAYLINGRDLIEFNINGTSKLIMKLPWEVSEMYMDFITKQLIIVNKNWDVFVLKV